MGLEINFLNKFVLHLEIPKEKRVNELTDDEILKIREYIDQNFKVEGDLRRDYSLSIKRLLILLVIEVQDIEKNYQSEVKEQDVMLELEKVKL